MKTVGDRIRQAREYRGLSGEELARRVGYKTQSGISNLENRATGRGGFALPRIAEELNFVVSWFLQVPDTNNMAEVPTFRTPPAIAPSSEQNPTHTAFEKEPDWSSPRQRAHHLLDQLSEKGLIFANEMLEALIERHPLDSTKRAGIPIPAKIKNTA